MLESFIIKGPELVVQLNRFKYNRIHRHSYYKELAEVK